MKEDLRHENLLHSIRRRKDMEGVNGWEVRTPVEGRAVKRVSEKLLKT
jgi:hypothetical protein